MSKERKALIAQLAPIIEDAVGKNSIAYNGGGLVDLEETVWEGVASEVLDRWQQAKAQRNTSGVIWNHSIGERINCVIDNGGTPFFGYFPAGRA